MNCLKIQNKKAIVLPETLKIIIGVLCIVILIYLAFSLYSIFTTKSKSAQARETLKEIAAKVDDLEEGQETDYLVVAPKDWKIISYKKGEESPKQCGQENCLCICKKPEIKECEKYGACKKIKNAAKTLGFKSTLEYSVENYIIINKAVIKLGFKLKNGVVEIYSIMEGEKSELFNEFLNSKSVFLDKGEIEIREQIKYFFNSNLIPAKREFSEEKKVLVKNIQNYFSDYEYPIYFFLYSGTGYWDVQRDNPILKVSAGKDREISKNEKIPEWPVLIVENPEGEYVKSLVVMFGLRE